jgi:hypothetical protein
MSRTLGRLAILLTAVALVAPGAGAMAVASPRDASPGSVPNPGVDDRLLGVSALSPTAAWAVGEFSAGAGDQTLVLRWNGTKWTHPSSPSPGGTNGSELRAVSAESGSDVWAVGWFATASRINTLILRWNGTSWTQVASPSPGVSQAFLNGVTVLSPTNAWAVGEYFDGTSDLTLILHWNGTNWTQVASPTPPGSDANLNGVSAHSASDIWAVGASGSGGNSSTFALHWDGGVWTQVPTPNPLGTSPVLNGVSASSATNAWATGTFFGGAQSSTLTERWNGTKWKVVASPNPGGSNASLLTGAATLSKTNAWASGYYSNGTQFLSLILHWNGTTWSQVTSPNPGTHSNSLNAISADAANNAWVAGEDNNRPGGFKNLLEHWDGSTWTAS